MYWWIELGYHNFDEGEDGFPKVGQVIKYYREKKKDERGKSMSQSNVATALGLKARNIRYIESGKRGVDIEKRQLLCKLLNIPPALLAITTAEEVMQLIEKKTAGGPIDIEENRQFLTEAHMLHQHSTAILLLNITKLKLDALYRQLPNTNSSERPQIYELLFSYHIFMQGELRELQQYDLAHSHLDLAMDYANLLNNHELQTVCQLHRARILEVQGRIKEATQLFDIASLNKESSMLKSMGLCYMSQLYADVATTEADKKVAMTMLERGGSIVRSHPEQVYIYGLDSSLQGYYLRKAHAQIGIGWPKEALDTLDMIQYDNGTWWHAYQSLYTAKSYLKLGKFELAVPYAQECLKIARKFSSPMNIARVQSIYNQIVARKYRGTDLAELGRMLKG